MPDLHGWITQQIDLVVAVAEEAADGAGSVNWQAAEAASCECCVHLRTTEGGLLCIPDSRYVDHMAAHDPAAVLRRCTADRKILARHRLNPDAIWYEAAKCDGCGTEGEMAYAVTENLNDCPELLDLGHAHGLTAEVLAMLDRPQEGERPDPTPGFGILEAIYEPLIRTALADVPPALRGPNWKAQP